MQSDRFNFADYWQSFVSFIDRHTGLWLIALSALFMLLGFWQDGINLDSTTYSVIARNVSEQNNWFTLHYTAYYHQHFAEHPPLVMWAQSIIFSALGASDTTSRIFSALCTIGSVGLAYAILRDTISKHAGVVSGLVLLLTYNFMQGGNATLLDYPMSFFILLALFAVVQMSNEEEITARSALLAGTGLGLAFLSKGVVAGPVWGGIALYIFLCKREWLLKRRFWVMPAMAILLVAFYLLGDYFFADGYFLRNYFFVQLQERFVDTAPDAGTVWYQFTLRMFELYLPFIIVLPFGCYLILKRRIVLLYPTLCTLLLYWLIYSRAPQLYYHYFAPMYALSAPVAGVALSLLLKKWDMNKIVAGLSVVWILLAVGVTVADVRIHFLRSPEIYSLTDQMTIFLQTRNGQDGVMVRRGTPEWDTIAKTSWYWRSDLKSVHTIEEAVMILAVDSNIVYILVPKQEALSEDQVDRFELDIVANNDHVTVYSR